MRWLAKAAVQGMISLVLSGHNLNYVMQKRVSRRLPRAGPDFDLHAETAAEHLGALELDPPGRTAVSLAARALAEF